MTINIDNHEYTVTLPFTQVNTHEGGLNTASIEIRNTDVKTPFQPFTRCTFNGECWVIDNDRVTYHQAIGKYTHAITLVEEIKELEKVLCGAKSVSYPIMNGAALQVTPTVDQAIFDNLSGAVQPFEDNNLTFTPDYSGGVLEIVDEDKKYRGPVFVRNSASSLRVYSDITSGENAHHYPSGASAWTIARSGNRTVRFDQDGDFNIITSNDSEVPSEITVTQYLVGIDASAQYVKRITYTINVIDATKTGCRKSVGEIANILLHTYEGVPLGQESYMRWHIANQAEQASYPNAVDPFAVMCPEMGFSAGATLKENLDQLAVLLHAKARMRHGFIFFEALTVPTRATIPGIKVTGEDSFTADKFGGEVQVFAQNVVNYSEEEGSVVGYIPRSLRAERGAVRVNDTDALIPTTYPIDRVVKVEYLYVSGGEVHALDITSRVLEETEYNTLSSYDGGDTKARYIYYTQGKSDIRGLFFQATINLPGGQALSKFAIHNIITQLGVAISENSHDLIGTSFKVTYIPIVDIRAGVPRQDLRGGNTSFVMNQASGRTDASSLGRKLLATAAQLTSNSPRETYLVPNSAAIPTAGLWYDENNVISEVAIERGATTTKLTVNISENYNKYDDYTEVDQAMRQYQIDVNNVQDRHILYRDYINLSFTANNRPANSIPTHLTTTAKREIINGFVENNNASTDVRIKYAEAITKTSSRKQNGVPLDDEGAVLSDAMFDVISLGIGNTLLFAFRYDDNFSVGRSAEPAIGTYYLQKLVPYGTLTGEADTLTFNLHTFVAPAKLAEAVDFSTGNARAFPIKKLDYAAGAMSMFGGNGKKMILCKDARETIFVEYQIAFVSTDGVFVGADACENHRLVSKALKSVATLHFYSNPIDPIKGTTEPGIRSYGLVALDNGIKIDSDSGPYEEKHKAWAIIRDNKFVCGANSKWGGANGNRDSILYFNDYHKI